MDPQPLVVLIVEDEEAIQHVVEDALLEGGFEVKIASSGEEAVKILDQKFPFKAVVTDVNLGPDRLPGWEVARHAREIDPTIAVVYMTGDSGADWAAQGVPNSVLLVKPFAPIQIVTAIAQLLNSSPH